MTAREDLIRDLANQRLTAIADLIQLRPDQSALLADEVFAEATWYVDHILPHAAAAAPLSPLPGHNGATACGPASRSSHSEGTADHDTPAGQGTPTTAAQDAPR